MIVVLRKWWLKIFRNWGWYFWYWSDWLYRYVYVRVFFFLFWFGKLFWFSFWKKLFGIWKCSWDNRLGLFFFCSGVNCWGFVSIFTTIEDLWVGFGWCFLELRRLRMIRWWVLGFMMWGINSDIVCFILGMWFCRLEVILRC